MKKLTVIAAMALLSVTAMTACGNKEDTTKDNQSQTADNQKDPDTAADDTNDNNTDATDDNTDAQDNHTADDNVKDGNTDKDTVDNKDSDKKEETNQDKTSNNNQQEKPVEAGEEPDFELNKKGCFNGSYEGNDGCTYKFTKKGKLIITSDSETMKYEYTLNDDVLSMIAEDGSFGTSRQITLLEDGTYLLDDNMGTQVILTYIEA